MSAGLAKDPWKVPRLVVWDVNDTIVLGSLDEAVISLLPSDRRHALSMSHKAMGWDNATHMTNVMKELQEFRIGRWAVESLIRSLPLHRLMVDAVREMHRERVVQVIISNSNVPFIYTLLEHYGLLDHFAVIFANEGQWNSKDCDSSMEVSPMHKNLDEEDLACTCNWQQTGICRRLALHSIMRYLKLDAWTALMHANWGLCAATTLKLSDFVLSRIGSRPIRSRLDGTSSDQTLEMDLTNYNQIKYQHGEDLINILRQPLSDVARATGAMQTGTGHKEDPSFLINTAHYFDDARLCSAADKRLCRKYPN